MTTKGCNNNIQQEATIKMFIAYINLLSFGTIFIILSSVVLRQ